MNITLTKSSHCKGVENILDAIFLFHLLLQTEFISKEEKLNHFTMLEHCSFVNDDFQNFSFLSQSFIKYVA